MDRQLSFFTAGQQQPVVDDLEGLLAGPGQIVRRGDAARISVVVSDGWRIAGLLAAFAERDLAGEQTGTVEQQAAVRTPFSPALLPLALRWRHGALLAPPPGFALDGPRLRLWALAGGRHDPYGYLLLLGGTEERAWQAIGAALQVAGVAASLLGPRAGGPAYRVTGRKRLARLRELVGDPPSDAEAGAWPTAESDGFARYV